MTSGESKEKVLHSSTLANYLGLKEDPDTTHQYQDFCDQSLSPFNVIAVTLLITVLVYPHLIVEFNWHEVDANVEFKLTEIILTVLAFISLWFYCCSVLQRKYNSEMKWQRKYAETAKGASILLTTLALTLNLFRRSKRESVLQADFLPLYQTIFVNIYDEINMFAMDSAIILMLVPIAQCILLREHRLSVLLSVYLMSLLALCISAPSYENYNFRILPVIIAYGLFGALILWDSLSQHLTMFFLNRDVLAAMLVQERSAEKVRQEELRHMIANVAHDLKSPLASFMSGIEVIYEDLKSLEKGLAVETDGESPVKVRRSGKMLENIRSIESTAQYVQNVNNFMLMTINRCLDCTKASNGLKLIPKYETIDLKEALMLPVDCMTNTQQKIIIELLPWHEGLFCSHTITDKQWLQENVLCLLSNAVKYSSGGTVTISVALKSKSFFPGKKCESHVSVETPLTNTASSAEGSFSLKLQSFRWGFKFLPFSKFKILPMQNPYSVQNELSISLHTAAQTHPNRSPTFHSIRSFYNVISAFDFRQKDFSEYLIFSVEDNGIGMSDEARQLLFNPFQQNQRLAGGTGLGLYSLSKRIDSLKGFYGVKKRKDGKQGSVFWFAIPYKPDFEMAKNSLSERTSSSYFRDIEEQTSPMSIPIKRTLTLDRDAEKTERFPMSFLAGGSNKSLLATKSNERLLFHEVPHSPLRISPPTTPALFNQEEAFELPRHLSTRNISFKKPQYSILIADDTPSVSKMMKKLLERHGHVVSVVENGMGAVNLVEKQMKIQLDGNSKGNDDFRLVDLILMDLQMPVMDGLEATKRIRALEKEMTKKYNVFFHQAIICVSANSDNETMEEATRMGIDAFISKPFTYETFRQTAEHLVIQLRV